MEKPQKIFEGYLILVIGNSGSGKDSIIKGAIRKNQVLNLYTPKRYITRKPSEDEQNFFITDEEFQKKSIQKEFALEWEIYDLKYGIPIEIDDWLQKGYHVIINVSRTVVEEAKQKYKNCKVIFVEVSFHIILKRLQKRGREDKAGLKERTDRAKQNVKYPNADFNIDNSGSLESAVKQFLTYVKQLETSNI